MPFLSGLLGAILKDTVMPLYPVELTDLEDGIWPTSYSDLCASFDSAGTNDGFEEFRRYSHTTLLEIEEPRRIECLRRGVKVGPKQYAYVYEMARYAASVVAIEVPNVFLMERDEPAESLGTREQSLIVLQPSLVTELSEHELFWVIGHEVGHIALEDYRLKLMLLGLRSKGEQVGRNENSTGWLEHAREELMLESCKHESLADRIGLMCCQSLEASQRALLTVELGDSSVASRIDVNVLIEQARHLPTQKANSTHPTLVDRVSFLQRFHETQYPVIIEKYMVRVNVAF